MLLPKSFYLRDDILQLSKDLLGKLLISEIDDKRTSGIIVETEAYRAPEDLASHARGNHMTPRNRTMFKEGGHAYVYISYGVHHLFNVVTSVADNPHAILIRAIQPVDGLEIMMERRGFKELGKELVNGPGKFSKAMGINVGYDASQLYDQSSLLKIEDDAFKVNEIISGPRVGMSRHTQQCGHWPYRFRIKGNKWTSKPNVVKYNW